MSDATTYAIAWQDDRTRFVGYLRLETEVIRLDGRGEAGREGLRTVPYDEVRRVELQRDSGSRGIALSLADGEVLLLASLDRPGSLGELADRLRHLTNSPHG